MDHINLLINSCSCRGSAVINLGIDGQSSPSKWDSDIFHLKDQLVKNENFVLNPGIFCRLAHQSPESVFSLPPASSFPLVDDTNSIVVEDSRSSLHRRNSS